MTTDVDHDLLNTALSRCGATWDASQAHGLLSSQLAVAGPVAGGAWRATVLDGTDSSTPAQRECIDLLEMLFDSTRSTLAERQSAFTPLLPDDSDTADARTRALAHWSEAYLHGLVSTQCDDALKARLAAEPVADIIKDMLQITLAAVDEEADDDVNEAAYAEIVEYLRVAAQLIYEELAEFRQREDREID